MSVRISTVELFNVVFLSMGVGICALNCLQSGLSVHIAKALKWRLQVFFGILTVYLAAGLAKCLLAGMPGASVHTALLLLSLTEFWMGGFATYFLSVMILLIAQPDRGTKLIRIALPVLTFLNAALVLADLRVGRLYYYDAANQYHQGPLYLLIGVCNESMMAINAVLLIRYRSKFDPQIRLSFWLYTLLPCVALYGQLLSGGSKLVAFTSIGAAVYMFFCIAR